jgi:copper chaperone
MYTFEVKDMTCNHCVESITQAVKAVDRDASVNADLTAKRVEIDSRISDAHQLQAAIGDAGFTPVAVS